MKRDEAIALGTTLRGTFIANNPSAKKNRACLRRIRSVNELLSDGVLWSVLSHAETSLGDWDRETVAGLVVLLSARQPSAYEESKKEPEEPKPWSLGDHLRYLTKKSDPTAKITVDSAHTARFRRVLATREFEDLVHQLRSVLKHIDRPIHWGELLYDLAGWRDERGGRDRVKQKWAKNYYEDGAVSRSDDITATE